MLPDNLITTLEQRRSSRWWKFEQYHFFSQFWFKHHVQYIQFYYQNSWKATCIHSWRFLYRPPPDSKVAAVFSEFGRTRSPKFLNKVSPIDSCDSWVCNQQEISVRCNHFLSWSPCVMFFAAHSWYWIFFSILMTIVQITNRAKYVSPLLAKRHE